MKFYTVLYIERICIISTKQDEFKKLNQRAVQTTGPPLSSRVVWTVFEKKSNGKLTNFFFYSNIFKLLVLKIKKLMYVPTNILFMLIKQKWHTM